jgi:hypothetical protein
MTLEEVVEAAEAIVAAKLSLSGSHAPLLSVEYR